MHRMAEEPTSKEEPGTQGAYDYQCRKQEVKTGQLGGGSSHKTKKFTVANSEKFDFLSCLLLLKHILPFCFLFAPNK
jgi:hypothetical protein